MTQRNLFIPFGNPGGGGKTTVARIITSLSQMAGRTSHIIDADAGNRSASQALPNSDALVWGGKSTVGGQIVDYYKSVDDLIIDCGANSSTDIFDIRSVLGSARMAADSQSRRTVALLPVTPNKPGAIGAAREAQAAFRRDGIDVHVILNDVDGSTNFVADEHGGISGVALPRLQSGIMAVLNSERRTIADMLRQPPEGFERAMDYAARWLERCSKSEAFAPYFGFGESPLSHSRSKIRATHFVIYTLADASNERLMLNEEAAAAKAAFLIAPSSSPEFFDRAMRYRECLLAYEAG